MKILIIRLSSLGDIVLTQPVVKRMHDVFPDSELYFFTKEQYIDIPRHFGVPLQVIGHSPQKSLLSLFKSRQFDIVIDLQAKLSSFLVRYLFWRAKKFVYNKRHLIRYAIVRQITSRTIDTTLDLYQTACLKASKGMKMPALATSLNRPRLFLDSITMKKLQSSYLKPSGKPLVALFPGATHNTKMYPLKYFIQVTKQMGEQCHFWLLGNCAEEALTSTIHSEAPDNTTDYGGRFSLAELLYITNMADIVITNDSGPMHIAAALGKRQIAIFGSTHPKLGFRPLNDKAVVVTHRTGCQPCSLHGKESCPLGHFDCMLKIDPQLIVSALKSQIQDESGNR